MPSQEDITGDLNAFDATKQYIKEAYQKPGNVYLGLLHRLDRPTGGVLVMAKTSKAATRVSKQFQSRKIQKTYYAITEKPPRNKSGTLIHYLRKLPDKNIMKAFDKEINGGKKAELNYRVLAEKKGKTLIEVKPLTGRKHQIRVQLASIGCTIQGDAKYGKDTKFNYDKSIALLSKELVLTHPTLQQKMTFSVDLPLNEIWKPFHNF